MYSTTTAFLWLLLASTMAAFAQDPSSPIQADERVVLFPTTARRSDDGSAWHIPIHGWIFEPEEDDGLRTYVVDKLRAAFGIAADDAGSHLFQQRMRLFLRDNERGKPVVIRAAERDFVLEPSAIDGHFLDVIEVPADVIETHVQDGWLTVRAVTRPDDDRQFAGSVQMLEARGMSVVSDIDDTVKVSEVLDKQKLLKNTFCQPFQAVPGMADLYRGWQERGASFHFVSSSPWQLYEPLSEFLARAGFPAASFHLKRIRLKDRTALQLMADSYPYKVSTIEARIKAHPRRQFILVGDSGEQDPEVYGHLARKHPDKILRILIRQVTEEPRKAPRYERAMKGVPPEKWQLFRDPAEIDLIP